MLTAQGERLLMHAQNILRTHDENLVPKWLSPIL